jgi:pyruvate dehydrogenase kinase 2/3/4
MQTLPYVVVTNPHMSQVYELYYKAFETLRRVKEIKTLEDNERFCAKVSQTLQEHLTVIPKIAMGVLECRDLMRAEDIDRFMNTLLRSVSSAMLDDEVVIADRLNSEYLEG